MTDRREVRTWAEINLDALAHNYRLLRSVAPESKFLGLVKANAYGHGAVPVARTLQKLGADMLAVACLAEAVELRRAGITIPILCLGQTPIEQASELLEYDVTQTVGDLETGKALSAAAVAAGKTLALHVKLDTGMGRLGFDCRKWGPAMRADICALCALPGLEAEGIFTHFANADGSEEYTRYQSGLYDLAVNELYHDNGLDFKIYHCAASAAVLNYPWTHRSMIRPGIALYGQRPEPSMPDQGLRAVMTVKSRITAVRDLPAGSKISYGCTNQLSRDSRIAVLPVGYADGLPRTLSNKLQVNIHGVSCPILGRICMDMCMADVTDLPQEVKAGDVAAVYDGDLNDIAELAGTITDELVCRIGPRVPRVYWENGVRLP